MLRSPPQLGGRGEGGGEGGEGGREEVGGGEGGREEEGGRRKEEMAVLIIQPSTALLSIIIHYKCTFTEECDVSVVSILSSTVQWSHALAVHWIDVPQYNSEQCEKVQVSN